MMGRLRTAVILAAGRGVRLGERGRWSPKGFLRLGEQPIIVESIAALRAAGIRQIVIVTGHLAEFYERLAEDDPGIVLVHNPDFAESGTLRSLACAASVVEEDFLLIESDLVYERRALDRLIAFPNPDAILLSGRTGFDDAVFVEGHDGVLVRMSKDPSAIAQPAGEYVGIARISSSLLRHLSLLDAEAWPKRRRLEYDGHGFVEATLRRPIHCCRVADLIWCEIDDENQLQIARDTIYPRVRASS